MPPASPHLHYGFKPATPVEEAFYRAKRKLLPSEPLTAECCPGFPVVELPKKSAHSTWRGGPLQQDAVILVNGIEYAGITLAWKLVTGRGKGAAMYWIFKLKPRSVKIEGRWRYCIADLREALAKYQPRRRRRL